MKLRCKIFSIIALLGVFLTGCAGKPAEDAEKAKTTTSPDARPDTPNTEKVKTMQPRTSGMADVK